MINIPDIHLEFLFPGNGVTPVDLCPSGDSRFHLMLPFLFWLIASKVLHEQWSGPDQTHISLQNIEKFGQFIDAGFTQEISETCQSLNIGESLSILAPIVGHS